MALMIKWETAGWFFLPTEDFEGSEIMVQYAAVQATAALQK